jgi:DNA-binding NtrC family response regulator
MSSVLLVEDNLLLCKLEKRYIEAAFPNTNLHIVHNGTDAEVAVKARPFDAVIMDCRLPKCDCLDLLDTISLTSPKAAIIIVSADPPKDLKSGSRRNRIFDIIEKPFEAEELIDVLTKALNTSAELDDDHTEMKFPLTGDKSESDFNRHAMLNILTGMRLGLRAFETDLAENAENSHLLRETIAEYIPKILKMVERATALTKQARE